MLKRKSISTLTYHTSGRIYMKFGADDLHVLTLSKCKCKFE